MRKSAIVVTCVFLVASLIAPGLAMAKGGNGRHAVTAPAASANANAEAGRDHGGESGADDKPAAVAQSKAASASKAVTTQPDDQPVAVAPKPDKSGAPKSTTSKPSASVAPVKVAVLESTAPEGLTQQPAAPAASQADEAEVRGVLDTVRVRVNESLADLRTGVRGIWSAVSSWFGD